MSKYTKTETMFEAWDGGHCYLRAILLADSAGTHVCFLRSPQKFMFRDLTELGAWAETLKWDAD